MSTFPRHSDQTATRPAPEISEERDSTRTPEDVRKEHDFARAYLNLCGEADIDWIMIRAMLASVADVAICSAAECSETGEHGAHESSRHAEWKLEMAVSSGSIER